MIEDSQADELSKHLWRDVLVKKMSDLYFISSSEKLHGWVYSQDSLKNVAISLIDKYRNNNATDCIELTNSIFEVVNNDCKEEYLSRKILELSSINAEINEIRRKKYTLNSGLSLEILGKKANKLETVIFNVHISEKHLYDSHFTESMKAKGSRFSKEIVLQQSVHFYLKYLICSNFRVISTEAEFCGLDYKRHEIKILLDEVMRRSRDSFIDSHKKSMPIVVSEAMEDHKISSSQSKVASLDPSAEDRESDRIKETSAHSYAERMKDIVSISSENPCSNIEFPVFHNNSENEVLSSSLKLYDIATNDDSKNSKPQTLSLSNQKSSKDSSIYSKGINKLFNYPLGMGIFISGFTLGGILICVLANILVKNLESDNQVNRHLLSSYSEENLNLKKELSEAREQIKSMDDVFENKRKLEQTIHKINGENAEPQIEDQEDFDILKEVFDGAGAVPKSSKKKRQKKGTSVNRKSKSTFASIFPPNRLLAKSISTEKIGLYNLLQYPPVKFGEITSHFGLRTDPFTKKKKNHYGVDIASPIGSEIIAPADGIVILSQFDASYGNHIAIYHGEGVVSFYAHNLRNLVKIGQKISKGGLIGEVGQTGRADGPHLHYEIMVNGERIDPMKVLNKLSLNYSGIKNSH